MKRIFEPNFFQHILGISGMINITSGIVFIVYPNLFFKFFFKDEIVGGPFVSNGLASILSLNLWSLILIMGFGYLWASKDPVKNKLFIFIGALGKIVASLSWFVVFFQGAAKTLMVFGATTDMMFGLLFFSFYLLNRGKN